MTAVTTKSRSDKIDYFTKGRSAKKPSLKITTAHYTGPSADFQVLAGIRTVAGFCTLAILKYNLPDVRSSGNESGLYDVDSSWPTEYWVVKKEIA
ncbi:hypothetical protein T03_14151 [Trichinella britovi]|uniref:Uncharacterized protein n=1 Tax=Trichinella britovi TaxID=45882 RepID=A0A0V1C898_TRIBR|nr:hypothetical protein T03_14151 [Trichinella britovi]